MFGVYKWYHALCVCSAYNLSSEGRLICSKFPYTVSVLLIIKKWLGSKFYSFICFFSQTKADQQSTYRFDSLISIERWSFDISLNYNLKNIMWNIIIERWYMLCSRVNLQANYQAHSHTNITTPPLTSKLSSRWAR